MLYEVITAVEPQLQLAVLIGDAARGHGRRALAFLAETFGPDLRVPLGEGSQPVAIGDDSLNRLARGARQADGKRRALGRLARRAMFYETVEHLAGAGADRGDSYNFV